jgi:hypothetical protein
MLMKYVVKVERLGARPIATVEQFVRRTAERIAQETRC